MNNCFDGLLGITRNPCQCIKDLLPPNYDVSESGLYMDEHNYVPFNLQITESVSGLCNKSFADLLINARDGAYTNFKTDLYKQLQLRFKPKYQPYEGYVGGVANSGLLNLTAAKIAHVIRLNPAKGVTMKVSAVLHAFSAAGVLTVNVHRGKGSVIEPEPMATFNLDVSTTPTKTSLADLNLEFSADAMGGQDNKIYFIYDNTGLMPRNFSNSCGCGDKERVLKGYLSAYGSSCSSLNCLGSAPSTPFVNGLNFEVSLSCGADDIICQARQQNPFLKAAIDATIQSKAVINLLQQVLNSTVITRFSQAGREQMHYNSLNLSKKYANDVQWIAENMSMSLNDCYTCQTENQPMYKTGILN